MLLLSISGCAFSSLQHSFVRSGLIPYASQGQCYFSEPENRLRPFLWVGSWCLKAKTLQRVLSEAGAHIEAPALLPLSFSQRRCYSDHLPILCPMSWATYL